MANKTAPSPFEMGLSYLSIPGPPLKSWTMGQLLDEAANKWEASEYLYDVPADTRLTFDQLKNQVDWLASGLLKIGLVKGDRIGILGANNYRWIITFLATAKVGTIVVPLNPNYESSELLYALNLLSVKCIVVGEPVKARNFYQILNQAAPDMKILKDGDGSPIVKSTLAPHLNLIIYMGNEQSSFNGTGIQLWTEVQNMGKEEKYIDKMNTLAAAVQFDDVFYIPFTSGTTGPPKGVMISHQSLINSFFRVGHRMCLTPKDRYSVLVSLSNMYGLSVVIYALCFGCSAVIPSSTFSPSTAINMIAQEKCTWVHGAPTMHYDMLNVPKFDLLDLTSLQGANTGGAPLVKALLAEMKEKYGISRVDIQYGITEVGGVTYTRSDDPPELNFISVGYPFENTEIKLIDGNGRIVPVGEVGEICSRSCSVMHGYWEDPEKTREVIDSAHWYHTGDAGYFLESGHLVLAGRFKDIINRGGEKFHPKEIEDFLYQNFQVEEVHVFGAPDERLGEVVAAWILPKPGVTMETDHVKGICAGKISRSKIPAHIKFVQHSDDFPRTLTGKVQKNVMRQQYEQELGLNKET